MKKKHYEKGGSIDDDVRARAMKSVEGLEGIKGSDIEDETGTVKGSIKRNEYGDLYDSEMKAAPKAKSKAEASKAEPKKAEPKKAESKKDSGEEPSFFKGTKGFKNIGEAFKAMRRSAGITSYKSGGSVSSASKRADGCAVKGKTKGRMV
jgi:hypothetical protein